VFQFYLKILGPASQATMLRPEGPSVNEAFLIYYELKAKGFADHFHTIQKIPPGKGPKRVDGSGNKLDVARRIWSDFVGNQPFEQVEFDEIQEALDLLRRMPACHDATERWKDEAGYRDMIERADGHEIAEAQRRISDLEHRGHVTKADSEVAHLEAKVPQFRTDSFLELARLPNTVGKMLMSLGAIHSNPFSICSWTNEEERALCRNEATRARMVWDDRLYDLYRTPVFQGAMEGWRSPVLGAADRPSPGLPDGGGPAARTLGFRNTQWLSLPRGPEHRGQSGEVRVGRTYFAGASQPDRTRPGEAC
jgi:hypothetical protein